jgi:phenylacetate-CoA ligase
MQRNGIDPASLPLKLAILGAEPWTESIRSAVERGLGVTATNIYGLSEIMGPGVSQEDFEEKGSGSYIWEDHFFPEVVDRDTGEPLPEGTPGVLVFTTLTKRATPVLRYWTNDITSLSYEHSKKRTHVKMGQIIGRADDMLIIRGVNLFHTQIEAVLDGVEAFTTNYQLIVSNNGRMDEVLVRVEINPVLAGDLQADALLHETDRFSNAYGRLLKKIKDDTGLSMRVELLQPGAIPRSEGGKLNRVVDERRTGGGVA